MDFAMSHVFISYVHENQEEVEKLSEALKNHGLEVWLDRDSISPGMRWKDSIRQAIKNGAYFIACFSTEYESRDKSYMNEELMLAIDELRQYSAKKTWFIPVLLSECNVPALSIGGGQTLLDFQWVNLYSDWDLGFQKLLRVLKSDEIEKIKELIDDHGYHYTGRIATRGNFEIPKKYYLREVHELKNKYGILYDPLKLDRR
jgi:hypothetical protein